MALPPQNPNPGELWIDHETGLIHMPKHQPVPLEGPTSGRAYEELKKEDAINKQRMHFLRRQMLSVYQCTQCQQKMSGKFCRVKWRNIDGVQAETLVCRDVRCDAPVVLVEDAADLRHVPGGRI